MIKFLLLYVFLVTILNGLALWYFYKSIKYLDDRMNLLNGINDFIIKKIDDLKDLSDPFRTFREDEK